MNRSLQRRKLIYEKWDKITYEAHIKRLVELMNNQNRFKLQKNNEEKYIERILETSHHSHKIAENFKSSCEKLHIKQQKQHLIQYMKELQFPKICKHKPSSHIKKSQSIDMNRLIENSILYQKITNVTSNYQKSKFDKDYTDSIDIKKNIKRNFFEKPKVRLETIYKESSFFETNFPQYSFTHFTNMLTNKKVKKYTQIYLKFSSLPFKETQDIKYSIEIISPKPKPILLTLKQIQKDLFLFKLPWSKTKNCELLTVYIVRYAQNDGVTTGIFNIQRGENRIDEIYNLSGTQVVGKCQCMTSWRQITKKSKIKQDQENIEDITKIQYKDNEQQNVSEGMEDLIGRVSIENRILSKGQFQL